MVDGAATTAAAAAAACWFTPTCATWTHPVGQTNVFRGAFGELPQRFCGAFAEPSVFREPSVFAEPLPRVFPRSRLRRGAFLRGFFAEPWPRSLFYVAFRGELFRDFSRSLGRGIFSVSLDRKFSARSTRRLRHRASTSASSGFDFNIDFCFERLRLRLWNLSLAASTSASDGKRKNAQSLQRIGNPSVALSATRCQVGRIKEQVYFEVLHWCFFRSESS